MATIRLKRATTARWARVNPILADGEPGYDVSTHRMKIGDGVTPWNELEESFVTQSIEPTPNTTLSAHVYSELPHPVYDDGPSFNLIYQNAKV